MWKGVISFGLVSIPVELYAAIDRQDVAFHLLNKDGTCRLRRKLYCPETGEEYEFNDTAKGYEISPDQYVLVQQEEIDRLKPEGGRTIDIRQFVDAADIDPIYYNHTYYLAPSEHGVKAYALLAEAMQRSHRVGIAKFYMHSSEYLAALRTYGSRGMVLETMYYAEDIRATEDLALPEGVEVDPKELKLAEQLIDNLYSRFEPSAYRNEYRERVQQLLTQKAEGKEIVLPEARERQTGKVVDLMQMLKESVAAQKRHAAAPGGGAKKPPGKKKTRQRRAA